MTRARPRADGGGFGGRPRPRAGAVGGHAGAAGRETRRARPAPEARPPRRVGRPAAPGPRPALPGRLRRRGTPALAALAALLLLPAAAPAQAIEVTAALEATDGLARAGAYVPVRFAVASAAREAVASVRVTSGPVTVETAWPLAPGGKGDRTLPVYFAGGDLAMAVEFLDAAGRTLARARPPAPAVRPVGPGAVILGLPPAVADLDAAARRAVQEALGAEALHVVRMPVEALAQAARFGTVLAPVVEPGAGPEGPRLRLAAFPPGATEPVQPAAHALFPPGRWPSADLRRLWMGLGMLVLAAGVAAALLHRRPLAAAGTVAGLGVAALAALVGFGGLRRADVREARFFYVPAAGGPAAVEQFVCLESRGGAMARYALARPGATVLPVPVLADAAEMFRPGLRLVLGEGERVEASGGRALVHILEPADPPFGVRVGAADAAALRTLAARADVVAALRIEGARATDAGGRTRPLDAWAVAWKAEADPDLAHAGRSLAWWARERQCGDAAVVAAWFRDPAPLAADAGRPGEVPTRLAALVVYGP